MLIDDRALYSPNPKAGASIVRVKRLGWSASAFLGYTGVMLLLERGMRNTGGPGIVALELAGSAARTDEILTAWGDDGRRWARWSMWLDFGYMLTYGMLVGQLVERVRSRHRDPIALRLLPIGAVAGDVVEGVSLLKVLDGAQLGANARRARRAALVKFALLVSALGYVGARSVQRVAPA